MNVFFERENYFHPSVLPYRGKLLLVMHRITAMDCFTPPFWCESDDGGKTWSEPKPIPTLAGFRKCADFRPIRLPDDRIAALMGLVENGKGYESVYLFYDGEWSLPEKVPSPAGANCRGACFQSAVAADGSLILPFFYKFEERFLTVTGRFRLEGKKLLLVGTGDPLDGKTGRGWYEPSVMEYGGKFYITLRCDENCAWVSESSDGLHWKEPVKWAFSDGTVLETGPTQQRWLFRGGKPWLVYTRRDVRNEDCFRWRAPLYASPFLPEKMCLDRSGEIVVFPRTDYRGRPGLYGNFHVENLPDRSFVSDAPIYFDWTPDRESIAWFTTSVFMTELR